MIAYYYNPTNKVTKSKILLKSELNASIPNNHDPERIGDYYLVHFAKEKDKPAYNEETQYVIYSDIKKSGTKYVRNWVVKDYTVKELEENAKRKAENEQQQKEIQLQQVHNKCDELLDKTDYLFNSDYDGTGSDNTNYMNAVKSARSTWRRLRQTDELTSEEIPEIPQYKDFA